MKKEYIVVLILAIALVSGYVGYVNGVNKIPDVSDKEKNIDMNNASIRTSFCETNGYTSSILYAYYETWNLNGDRWQETDVVPSDNRDYDGQIYIRCKKTISTTETHDYSYTDYKRWIYASSVER